MTKAAVQEKLKNAEATLANIREFIDSIDEKSGNRASVDLHVHVRAAITAHDAHEFRREVEGWLDRWDEALADSDEIADAMAAFARGEAARDVAEEIMLTRY